MQHRIPYRRVLSEQNGYRFHFHRRFLFRPRDSDPVLNFGHPLNTGHRTHDTQRQKKLDHFSNLARNTPQPNPFKVLAGRRMADLRSCLRHEWFGHNKDKHKSRRTL